jgi:hypothetical protein
LHLAASTFEADVEAAVAELLVSGHAISADAIKAMVAPQLSTAPPEIAPLAVDLEAYDTLLERVGT